MASPQELKMVRRVCSISCCKPREQDEEDRQFSYDQSLHCKQNEARYTFRLGVLQEALEVYNSSRAAAVSNALDAVSC